MNATTEDSIERIAERMMDRLDRRLMTEREFTLFAYNIEVRKLDAWVKEQLNTLPKRA